MRNLDVLLENKKIDNKKLLDFGFMKKKNELLFQKNICKNQFQVIISITEKKKYSKVIDLFSEDEYTLVDVVESVGEFVGSVREEYEKILQDFMSYCTNPNVFKSKQSIAVVQYIKEKYGDELEFLWNKLPEAAIWRNKENQKWYGIIMKINEKKLGIDSDKMIEIIDLRCLKEEKLVDNKKIFPGYHMNKQSWITIRLDGSMKTEELYEYIDRSYQINKGSGAWIFPTNPKMFDIIHYMDSSKEIKWHKALNVLPNDLIYIYVGAPYSAIMYQCKIKKVKPSPYQKKEITMEVIKKYDKDRYPMNILKEHGLKTVRWAHGISEELSDFLKGK